MSGFAAVAIGVVVVAAGAGWHRPRRRPTSRARPVTTAKRPVARSRPHRPPLPPVVAATVLLSGLMALAGLLLPAIALLGSVLAGRRMHRRARARRTAAAFDALVPELIELVLVAVHAGMTPAQAVLGLRPFVAAPLVPAIDEIDRRVRSGERFADALPAPTEIGGREFQPLVGTLSLAERTGDALGPVLDRLADEARRDRRRLAEVSARELPVRLSVPLVCCTLPAFLLLTIAPVLAGALSSLRAAAP